MNEIDPKILEYAKGLYGETCELVRRTEWSYSFKCGPKMLCSLSRFAAEKDFAVSADVIRRRWPSMDRRERLDFASNFHHKKTWTDNDTEILEIVMNDGDDRIWSICALAMLRHPDRNRVVEFLIDRVQHSQSECPPLNYMQALGMAKDARAVASIRPYYDQYLKAMEAETVTGIPDDLYRGPVPYFPFLCIAGSLYQIESSSEYEQAIRKYFDHPKEQVRWWAEYALGVEGPTTAKRRAEDRESYLKRSNRKQQLS
jgi:hypothetical protein